MAEEKGRRTKPERQENNGELDGPLVASSPDLPISSAGNSGFQDRSPRAKTDVVPLFFERYPVLGSSHPYWFWAGLGPLLAGTSGVLCWQLHDGSTWLHPILPMLATI